MNQQMQDLAVAAAQGDANAQHQLGAIFLAGDTSIADHTQALKLLTKAAEQGHVEAEQLLGKAYFELGRAYFTNATHRREPNKAVAMLMQALEHHYTPAYEQRLGKAYFELGRAYFTNGTHRREPNKAVAMLMQALEHHYTPAYRALATIYTLGAEGLDRCLVTVLKMLQEGATLGDVECQYELGCTILDKSRRANDQHAIDGIKWLTIAGMQDHKPAQLMLAEIYQDNEYAKPDVEMKLFWLCKSQMNNRVHDAKPSN